MDGGEGAPKSCVAEADDYLLDQKEIEETQQLLYSSGIIQATPLIKVAPPVNEFEHTRTIGSLHLKLESMQTMGCFKTRGVVNMMHHLPAEAQNKGMVTMSAGNFGRTFAFAAQQRGISARVYMPLDVPTDRVEVVRSFGVQVELAPRTELQHKVDQAVREEGLYFAHPFDDPLLFAGYASIGLEIVADLPDVDVVFVGVGGGGLISGIATALKRHREGIRVIGVEPSGAAAMHLSLQKGHVVTLDKITTFVNGLAPPYAGKNALRYVQRFVDQVVLVEDEEVKHTMSLLFHRYKLVVEAAGAAALAALLYNKVSGLEGKKVCCLISGGNISISELSKVLQSTPGST